MAGKRMVYEEMRWICLNRPEDRDNKLTKRGEEWLDGLYEKDEV